MPVNILPSQTDNFSMAIYTDQYQREHLSVIKPDLNKLY